MISQFFCRMASRLSTVGAQMGLEYAHVLVKKWAIMVDGLINGLPIKASVVEKAHVLRGPGQ